MSAPAASPPVADGGALLRALVRLVPVLAFVVAPVVYQASLLGLALSRDVLAGDLINFELPAARIVLDGDSPYPGYGYPPLVAFSLIPLVPIPGPEYVATVLLILAVPLVLWLLDVRDWRCYGMTFLWAPTMAAIQTANVTIPMLVCLALAWRYRDSARATGLAVGLAVAAKMLAWPAGLWLLATRRVRGWAIACVTALAVTIGLWAILGFDGLFDYPDTVKDNGAYNATMSFTVTQLLADLGVERRVGQAVAIAVAAALLLACAAAGRTGRDRLSFALAAGCCIFASPINWLHSFLFLLIAVAVLCPRLSVAWFVPLVLHVAPGVGNGETWVTATALAAALATLLVAVATRQVPDDDLDVGARRRIRPQAEPVPARPGA